jgi:ribosomal protein L12E/L44/L45/RPP1/RPP2
VCDCAQASGVEVASFWPKLFVGAMKGEDMNKLICSLPTSGGGGGGDAAPAAAAAGGAAAPAGEDVCVLLTRTHACTHEPAGKLGICSL